MIPEIGCDILLSFEVEGFWADNLSSNLLRTVPQVQLSKGIHKVSTQFLSLAVSDTSVSSGGV
jgi:hypothetical protein